MSFREMRIPVIKGSALKALEGDPVWEKTVEELMEAVDSYIPTPVRGCGEAIPDAGGRHLHDSGPGTVATAEWSGGKVKVNETVEIVGHQGQRGSTVSNGRGNVQEAVGRRHGGRHVGLLLRGVEREGHRAWAGNREAGFECHAAHEVQG